MTKQRLLPWFCALMLQNSIYSWAENPDPTLKCPDGTIRVGGPPPDHLYMGCQTPDGVNSGPAIAWHSNGNKKTEGTYQAGKLNGKYATWHPNGAPMSSGEYYEGELSGHWLRWFSNGIKESEGDWKNGAPEGHWILYFKSGNPKAEGDFENGEKICDWKTWNPQTGVVQISKEKDSPRCASIHLDASNLPQKSKIALLIFNVGLITVFQEQGGKTYSIIGGWAPQIKLNHSFALSPGLAFSLFTESRANRYAVLDACLLVDWINSPLEMTALSVGGGFQSWFDSTQTGTNPMAVFKTIHYFDSPFLQFIDGLFFRYSLLFVPTNRSHEITLGVQIEL